MTAVIVRILWKPVPGSVREVTWPGPSKAAEAVGREASFPRPPNVALMRDLWSLLDGIGGVLKGSWGVVVVKIMVPFWVLYSGPYGLY